MKRLSCVYGGVRVLPLRRVWIPCDYARLRVRGGVGRVVSFASLRVVSSRSSVSLLCVHVRGRVDARLRVFYVYAILGFVGIFGIFACACLQ